MHYQTIAAEGGLLPVDILDSIIDPATDLPGQAPQDFGVERGRSLGDRIAAAWQAARGHWMLFKTYADDLRPDDPGTSVTRQRWVLPLLDVLGYQPEFNKAAYSVAGRSYAISHRLGPEDDAPPLHIEGFRTLLDRRPDSGRPRMSPHSLVQEYLNSTEQLWGLVSNGERLRLLRDSSRFTMPVYVEFNLRAMFEGELFSEFALLYRLLHRSRMPQPGEEAASSLLEQYHRLAVERGGRVRDGLRGGVEQALRTLGGGLLAHPANAQLREQVRSGALADIDYYRQLLRLVYRLLFLMVAEERLLIAAAPDDEADALGLARLLRPDNPQRVYREHYSLARLRALAERPGAGRGPYDDLWQGLQTTFRIFSGDDERSPAALGLAPLDGDLFGPDAIPALEGQRLRNAHLLAAIRALSLYRDAETRAQRRVNYAALDVEELGSVYESLLDYRPLARADGDLPELDGQGLPSRYFQLVAGTERKTTGSYYTRPELVKELIRSALIPVLDERLREAAQALRGDAPAARAAQERAILAMRVCDPACGSGHFLLEAARRLGRELARVRSGEDQPSPQQFRLAVRDVVQHCIYGVDLNPLAVDLCKLALWLEGHSAGMPLSFLDNHIKHGNSLVGATSELVRHGIPDDAYKAVTGDDKKTASDLRKRNKREREAYLSGMIQRGMFDAPAQRGMADLARAAQAVDAMATGTVAEVRAKAQRYQDLYNSEIAYRERARFDLWTAAFFLPLTPKNAATVPTTDAIDAFERRIPMGNMVGEAQEMATKAHFFHWELEFPEVFVGGAGGFDVVLGNPPWEMMQLDPQEFFFGTAPEIANAANMAARNKLIEKLKDTNPELYANYKKAEFHMEGQQKFVHESGRFPLTSFGRINLMALFAELSRATISPYGRSGQVLPLGISTDAFTQKFFSNLVDNQELVSIIGFENESFIFPGVHNAFKFCALTISGKKRKFNEAYFMHFCREFKQLQDTNRIFTLSPEDISLMNPNTKTSPIFRTGRDAILTKKIYNNVPILSHNSNLNRWSIKFMLMFMMNTDSHLFTMNPEDDSYPLYEGKIIWHYDHRFSTYEAATQSEINSGRLPQTNQQQKENPDFAPLPRYWVNKKEAEIRLDNRGWTKGWILGFRDITSSVVERTAIFSLLPRTAVGNKIPLILPKDATALLVSCLLACVNSLVFDFVTRQKIGGTSLNFFIVEQLPVLPPEAFSAEDIAYIAPRVAELVYTAWDMQPFAADLWAEAGEPLRAELLRRSAECNQGADPALFAPRGDLPLPPYRWDEERRALARAQLDARIARLYGLTRDELRYILDPKEVHGPDFPGETFRVLKEKEQKLYGEYRTRRLVLEAWDAEAG